MAEKLNILDILTAEAVVIDMTVETKDDVIRELSQRLFDLGKLNDLNLFMDDVYEREASASTGIGEGVAIPHGKSNYVTETSIAVGVLRDSVVWESIDEERVSVVFLLAIREQDANNLHLKILQKIAQSLADDEFINDIKNAQTSKELISIFNQEI